MRRNVIWDEGERYSVEHIHSHEKCFFSKDDKALRFVQNAIKRDGSFCPYRNWFYVQPAKKKEYNLAQLLYSAYTGRSMAWIRQGEVKCLDGDHRNLTKSNLVHTKEDCADNATRRIWHEGEFIFILHKSSGMVFFCDYEPELFDLLCHHSMLWGYQADTNRLQITVFRERRKAKDLKFRLHTLVYAYYHYGARCTNYIGAIRKIQSDFGKHSLSLDHLDNMHENNCIWNLSPMTSSQNSTKASTSAKIRYPFFLYAVYKDGIYRVACGRIWGEWFLPRPEWQFVICKGADSLNKFLKYFWLFCTDGG